MAHDTSKDPRLLVAHKACQLLARCVQQKSGTKLPTPKEKLVEIASRGESAVMTLTYMFQDPEELVGSAPMTEVEEAAETAADALGPVLASSTAPPLLRANVVWCLRTLQGLSERLRRPARSMAAGVDLVAVRVNNVSRLTPGLWQTRVGDGGAEYTVVTNLAGVTAGQVLAVAFLPPREVGGTISEAMFLGAEARSEAPGEFLPEDRVDAREAASILHDELGRR